MTGLIGGTVDAAELEAMASATYQEDWYEIDRAGDRGAALGVIGHGNRDPDANVVWRGDGAIGAVYGVVSNRDRLSLSWDDLFAALGDRPGELLERLEGPFAIAYVDTHAGEVHLATDKAGSRPVYYAADDGFRFASELSPLLAAADDASIDERAVGDLLMLGHVVGERTLVDGVAALPPASRLTYADGDVSVERYWYPERSGLAPEGYPEHWLDTYCGALSDVAATAGDLSLWLPGDADSRVAAGVLDEMDYPFDALTHRSPTGRERESAREVAEYLGVPQANVGYDTDLHLVDAIERAVDATDAMVNWATVPCLPFATGGLHDRADVVAAGGNFLGADAWAARLGRSDAAVEALYEHKRVLPAGRVRDLLAPSVDPRRSLQEEVAASVGGPTERRALDAARRLYAYSDMRANAVYRSQVGTRAVAHGQVLDAVIRMPARYRLGTQPLSDDGPRGKPPIRRAVIRRLDPNLGEIPAGRPAGGSALDARDALVEAPTGARSYAEAYYHDERTATFLDDLLVDARDRGVFDGDAVADLHRAFAGGETHQFPTVAAVAGLELWAQRTLDDRATATPIPQL